MRPIIALAALAALLVARQASAGTFEVAPTVLNVASASEMGLFYITNRGAVPVVVQIEGFGWRQTGSTDQLIASPMMEISPPMARLLPGQKQTVRLAFTARPAVANEQSYRLLVSELPDPALAQSHAVQELLQFNIPVFVAAPRAAPAELSWEATREADKLVLTARNDGARHVKLTGLALVEPGGRHLEIAPNAFTYILPGATRRWSIAVPHAMADAPLEVFARDETDGAFLTASPVLSR